MRHTDSSVWLTLLCLLGALRVGVFAAALPPLGGRKFGTPLLTASTPVRAVQPWANARISNSTSTTPPVFVTVAWMS